MVVDTTTNVSEITGRGDKVISYTPISPNSQAPHHMGHGVLDEGVYRMEIKMDEELDRISQAVAAWRGESPSGSAKSGVAIDSLRSQAEFMFSGPVTSWNNGWKETVRKGVSLYQKHYTMQQLIAIIGPNRETELQSFINCDLDDCVEWMSTKNGLPRTRDERRQEMITLFDRGLLDINDPGVRQKGFELFGETGMLGTFNKDATRARMENALIKSGQPPLFMPEIEDKAVHLSIHGDIIKSPDFLKWPQPQQQAMIQHYMQTKQALAAEQPPQSANPAAQPQPGGSAQWERKHSLVSGLF